MEYQLVDRILDESVSNVWEVARMEWKFIEAMYGDGRDSCVCGHHPIIELCFIENQYNGRKLIVGNCCVKKFMPQMKTDAVFRAIKKKTLNQPIIDYAYQHGCINDWEFKFLASIKRKRILSEKQKLYKQRLSNKIWKSVG